MASTPEEQRPAQSQPQRQPQPQPRGRSAGELTSSERMTVRFHLTCLATLVPYHQRPAALEAWLALDPGLFITGLGPPTPVSDTVVHVGGTRLRAALARTTSGGDIQQALLALDVPEIDAALRDNLRLTYETTCLLRLRDPAATAAGRAYGEDHHRRALLSADPELAAAALLDPRGKIRPTTRAAAWATVRAAGGTARVRRLAAALAERDGQAHADRASGGRAAGDRAGGERAAAGRAAAGPAAADRALAGRAGEDPVGADVVAACAEADPEPFLDAVSERWLGTGALLRRLRAAHRADHRPWRAGQAMRSILKEPYRIDWGLIAAARLGRRLPRTAAELLRARPDCPPEVAAVLRTGRPARPGRPLPPPVPGPAAPQPYGATRTRWVPEWAPPGDTGPLGDTAESARHTLRTRPVAYDARTDPDAVTLGHLGAAIERGQLSAREAVPLVRPASVLTSWVGQSSGWADVSRAAWSGRAALHVETAALLARWACGHVPAERWAALYPLLRHHPGTLPELLAEVTAAHPG
ncbi:hypothetical protein ACLF6K_02480 [Streptomyces xanthophaeus]|uniref:hypothetical protein n=1 Tax=Streptomyces xanthophaeus TaxID=67385 RepID=UPI00398FB496